MTSFRCDCLCNDYDLFRFPSFNGGCCTSDDDALDVVVLARICPVFAATRNSVGLLY